MRDDKYCTCFYCGFFHAKVEAEGIWHCPNALCTGPGGEWFRSKMNSYKIIDKSKHTVDENEWLDKGIKHNRNNKIPIYEFRIKK